MRIVFVGRTHNIMGQLGHMTFWCLSPVWFHGARRCHRDQVLGIILVDDHDNECNWVLWRHRVWCCFVDKNEIVMRLREPIADLQCLTIWGTSLWNLLLNGLATYIWLWEFNWRVRHCYLHPHDIQSERVTLEKSLQLCTWRNLNWRIVNANKFSNILISIDILYFWITNHSMILFIGRALTLSWYIYSYIW